MNRMVGLVGWVALMAWRVMLIPVLVGGMIISWIAVLAGWGWDEAAKFWREVIDR